MRPRKRRYLAVPLTLLALAATAAPGCAGTPQHAGSGPTHTPTAAAAVTGDNFADVMRQLDENPPDAVGRPLRDAAARYEAARGMDRLNDGDIEGAVRALAYALVHYTPEEISSGSLPNELAPLARGVLELVAQRGDEARALAANRVLMAVTPPDPDAQTRFQTINDWGDSNRREFRAPWVYRAEMAEIYREVARIVPARDMVERATQMQIERRRSAMEARPTQTVAGRRLTFEDMQQWQMSQRHTPVDLAVIYLRIGDLSGAADQLEQLAGDNHDLAVALRSISNGEGGADALAELAARLETVDVDAQAGVCRRGRRQFPSDPRFALCLAAAAARAGQLGIASAHFEAAATLSPGNVAARRDAIAASVNWLESEMLSDSPVAGRRALARAQLLLAQWPTTDREPPPVTPGELEVLGARLEMGQANLPAAQQHLERAIASTPPPRDAFLSLAEIAWRKNDPHRAIEVLQQGLAVPLQPRESDSTFRPIFWLRLGLAAHAAGDATQSQQNLEQAAVAFEALSRSLTGAEKARASFQHAVAMEALGRMDDARRDLDAAVNAAPDSRDLASAAVTFALGRGLWSDAREIDAGARGRLGLERPWQVYFAMWGLAAARLSGAENDGGAARALEQIAQTASEHSPWTVRLAQRYHGAIDRDQLLHFATTPGQRAEAMFYEGLLELTKDDVAGAERDLRAVLASDMLPYLEYDMAWEMVSRGVANLRANANAQHSAAPAAAPTTAAATPEPATPAPAPAPATPPNTARAPNRAHAPRRH